MPDLDIIPCYKSDECENTFQCGTNSYADSPICYANQNNETVPAGYNSIKWGYNINSCDGILLSCCDEILSQFNCDDVNYNLPALDADWGNLGIIQLL